MNDNASPRFIAIGNAIVDVQCSITDDFLPLHGIEKGSMALVDAQQAATLYAQMGASTECSGGSAANTAAGIATLGTSSAFVGTIGDDQFGTIFSHDLRAQGVAFETPCVSGSTGHCLILISSCGQRTMRTHLGTASQIPKEALHVINMKKAEMLLVEGYLWSDPTSQETVRLAMQEARDYRTRVAFGASSVSCIEAHRDDFLSLINDGAIDILFANEEEVMALTRAPTFEEGAQFLSTRLPMLVATLGAQGSIAYHRGVPTSMPAHPVTQVIDTTGAGDMFCAGFLHAWMEAGNVSYALKVASIIAAEAISHYGARPQKDLRQLLAEVL